MRISLEASILPISYPLIFPREIISQTPNVALRLHGRHLAYRELVEMEQVCKCYPTRNGWSSGVEKLRPAAALG